MEDEIIVGTVRGTRDGKHIVVRRNGKVLDVVFDGEVAPLIGGDVVGRVRVDDEGVSRMTLKRSVLDALLEGKTRIFMMGSKPELTARMFAKMVARSKSAMIAPGAGASIERKPISDDADLQWAMDAFQSEAERLGLALNVIDIQTMVRSPYSRQNVRDYALPADVEGNRRALFDLEKLLKTNFPPQCNRMVEKHSGDSDISVNFVLPYSPFLGAHGFARKTAWMPTSMMPQTNMSISETRRLSAARTIALALAHNRLGAGKGLQADVESSPRTLHMAACFADAAASLAFIAAGGRRAVVSEYADLKEASLHFGEIGRSGELQDSVLAEATHKSIRAAAAADIPHGASAKDIVNAAVRIARRTALGANRFGMDGEADRCTEQEAEAARIVAGHVSRDINKMSFTEALAAGEVYRMDIEALVEEFQGSEHASELLHTYGPLGIPDRMSRVYDAAVRMLPRKQIEPSQAVVDREKLAKRIAARSARDDDDEIEFAVPGM